MRQEQEEMEPNITGHSFLGNMYLSFDVKYSETTLNSSMNRNHVTVADQS